MKFLYLISVLIASQTALAMEKADPRFSFEAASEAFASASPVSVDQLTGSWMMVGSAQFTNSELYKAGYWPDGKLSQDSQPGYYYDTLTIEAETDAFGNPALLSTETFVGAESGKLYVKIQCSGSTSSNEANFILTSDAESGPDAVSVCKSSVACRFVESQQMLLCAATVVDKRETCYGYPRKGPTTFNGYFRKP